MLKWPLLPGERISAAPTARSKEPIRIFSVDPKYGPNPYSYKQISQLVNNFNSYQRSGLPGIPSALVAYFPKPDVGISHEPGQQLANVLREDLPNCGEPTRLFMQGLDLFAEIDRMPINVAVACESGELRDVSVEIYPNYLAPDGTRYGPMLKRISLLGATQPILKGLKPQLQFVRSFSEPSRNGRAAQQVLAVFSEGVLTMTREAALQILQAAGIDVTGWTPETFPDMAVIAFANYIQAGQVGAGAGVPPSNPVTAFSEAMRRELRQAVNPLMVEVNSMRADFGKVAAKAVEQEITTFSETNKKKLFAYERDATNPNYINTRLKRLPADAREAEMAAIASRPDVNTFSESMPGSGTADGGANGTQTGAKPTPSRIAELQAKTARGRAALARQTASKN